MNKCKHKNLIVGKNWYTTCCNCNKEWNKLMEVESE